MSDIFLLALVYLVYLVQTIHSIPLMRRRKRTIEEPKFFATVTEYPQEYAAFPVPSDKVVTSPSPPLLFETVEKRSTEKDPEYTTKTPWSLKGAILDFMGFTKPTERTVTNAGISYEDDDDYSADEYIKESLDNYEDMLHKLKDSEVLPKREKIYEEMMMKDADEDDDDDDDEGEARRDLMRLLGLAKTTTPAAPWQLEPPLGESLTKKRFVENGSEGMVGIKERKYNLEIGNLQEKDSVRDMLVGQEDFLENDDEFAESLKLNRQRSATIDRARLLKNVYELERKRFKAKLEQKEKESQGSKPWLSQNKPTPKIVQSEKESENFQTSQDKPKSDVVQSEHIDIHFQESNKSRKLRSFENTAPHEPFVFKSPSNMTDSLTIKQNNLSIIAEMKTLSPQEIRLIKQLIDEKMKVALQKEEERNKGWCGGPKRLEDEQGSSKQLHHCMNLEEKLIQLGNNGTATKNRTSANIFKRQLKEIPSLESKNTTAKSYDIMERLKMNEELFIVKSKQNTSTTGTAKAERNQFTLNPLIKLKTPYCSIPLLNGKNEGCAPCPKFKTTSADNSCTVEKNVEKIAKVEENREKTVEDILLRDNEEKPLYMPKVQLPVNVQNEIKLLFGESSNKHAKTSKTNDFYKQWKWEDTPTSYAKK